MAQEQKVSTEKQTISQRASVNGEKAGKTYDRTVAALRILVDGKISEQKLPPKNGGTEERTIYSQLAIIIGGSRPLNWAIKSFGDSDKTLKAGCYAFGRDIFKLGQYDRLELSVYPESLVFLRDLSETEQLMFGGTRTDASELMN